MSDDVGTPGSDGSTGNTMDNRLKEWAKAVEAMIEGFRAKNPGDTRTDRELAASLMESFVAHGLVQKRVGKFVVPGIEDHAKLIAMVVGPLRN